MMNNERWTMKGPYLSAGPSIRKPAPIPACERIALQRHHLGQTSPATKVHMLAVGATTSAPCSQSDLTVDLFLRDLPEVLLEQIAQGQLETDTGEDLS
jgi:hypothetical protein